MLQIDTGDMLRWRKKKRGNNERSEATCEAGGGAKLILLITRVSVYYAKNLSVHRNWFSKFERYSLLLSKNLEPNE